MDILVSYIFWFNKRDTATKLALRKKTIMHLAFNTKNVNLAKDK